MILLLLPIYIFFAIIIATFVGIFVILAFTALSAHSEEKAIRRIIEDTKDSSEKD